MIEAGTTSPIFRASGADEIREPADHKHFVPPGLPMPMFQGSREFR